MTSAELPIVHLDRIPVASACADCGVELTDRFGWCGGCQAAYCLPCGRGHYCRPDCPASGCHAGLCVRLVEHGVLAETWGLPPE